ncbi:MAG: hypothetical protein H0U87_00420 [Acidobacteria bacterium]|jgi:hypothetical protein|nr:hypothetical protein [Acidobacteriota bacterium]
MSENATTTNEENNRTASESATSESPETAANTEDVSYHAVEKDGSVTAIWEMQGRKHIRTIDPRSGEGKQILALFETAA